MKRNEKTKTGLLLALQPREDNKKGKLDFRKHQKRKENHVLKTPTA